MLDEPTNDLDIATLEILEESLLDFPGALVVVSHDRQLIDRVTTEVLALDGQGGTQFFADYSQWQAERQSAAKAAKKPPGRTLRPAKPKAKRLSYLEQREFDGLEEKVLEAETAAEEARQQAEDPELASDAARLQEACEALDEAQREVDRLYERWAELEAKRE